MSACEQCWTDAGKIAYATGTSTAEEYSRLIEKRKNEPCSPREQAGQFWDEEAGRDRRTAP